jgi:hypothetical protein
MKKKRSAKKRTTSTARSRRLSPAAIADKIAQGNEKAEQARLEARRRSISENRARVMGIPREQASGEIRPSIVSGGAYGRNDPRWRSEFDVKP